MLPVFGIYVIMLLPWSPLLWFPETSWLIYDKIYTPLYSKWMFKLAGDILVMIGIVIFLVACLQLLVKRKQGVVTNGLYSFVRHPQLLGIMLATFGWTLQAMRPIAVIAWITLVYGYLLMAYSEESYLKKRCQDDYLSYKQRVPFILPFLSPNISKLSPIKMPKSRLKKIIFLFCLYLLIVAMATIILKQCSYAYPEDLYCQVITIILRKC